MSVVRIWLPVAILLAGVVLVIVRGGDETSLEGAAALWGAGLSVALLNWLHRMGVTGRQQPRRRGRGARLLRPPRPLAGRGDPAPLIVVRRATDAAPSSAPMCR